MKKKLTIDALKISAKMFCEKCSKEKHNDLLGITDGKAVGTYIEHKLQEFLLQRYELTVGSSASGLDLPDDGILTDIKVTSIRQPQSSCPFKSARQKIYGLGYNLLVLVYEKKDINGNCIINFTRCTFIEKHRTGDFTITKRLIEMLKDGANKEDIVGFLQDKNVPGDDIVYSELADEILINNPIQGYLTISNALQWRLQYSRVIELKNKVSGVTNYEW